MVPSFQHIFFYLFSWKYSEYLVCPKRIKNKSFTYFHLFTYHYLSTIFSFPIIYSPEANILKTEY